MSTTIIPAPQGEEGAPTPHPASFRDPNGYVYEEDGVLYRRVAPGYDGAYRRLMESGLYGTLADAGRLVRHDDLGADARGVRTLRPERLPFVSHPYEWCFGQLRDAALATLALQRTALDYGMTLKDASAFNIAFHRGRAILLDTLSFDLYQEGQPWVAYRQFCEHFLAPLALVARADIRLSHLMRAYLDGIPLDLTARLLPLSSRLNPGLLLHIHAHAKAQYRQSGAVKRGSVASLFPRAALLGLLNSLEGAVRTLTWEPTGTVWADYYEATNYSEKAADAKRDLVRGFIARLVAAREQETAAPAVPPMAWDFGANDGRYSRLAADAGFFTVAWDIDPASVERAWRATRREPEGGDWLSVLPLLQDISNPSPDCGWEGQERSGLFDRGPAHLVLALALVHHLALGKNVPLPRIARLFARAGRWLVVEFVPKHDSQAQRLLATKGDLFPDYDEAHFEAALDPYFEIVTTEPIPATTRRLYLCRGRGT